MILNRIIFPLFLLIYSVAFPQQVDVKNDTLKSNVLDEVVITATRTLRQLSSVPLAVTLVSKKQIQQVGSTRLKNILEEQTGILFVRDASGFSGVQMQGIGSAYTLILIDGVPLVGRSSGNLDLERISVNNIKQIEIVKGPSSSLYGSEAIGGVINIITDQLKYNIKKVNIALFTRGGNNNEIDFAVNYLYKKNKFEIISGLNLNTSKGYDLTPAITGKTTEAHQNFTGNLKLKYHFNSRLNLSVSNRFYTQNQKETTDKNRQTEQNFNAQLYQKLSENAQLDYTFYATIFNTESVFNGSDSYYKQRLLRPEIRAKFLVNNGEIMTGLGARFNNLDRTFFAKKESYQTQYVFAQYDFYLIKKLNVIVGARFDHHNKYKSALSPKISSRYQVNNWLALKGSVGFGFKAPDFRQLFFNFNNSAAGYMVFGVRTMYDLFGSNPQVQQQVSKDLKPENSVGYNIGFQLQPINGLGIDINFFRNDIKDLINTAVFNGSLAGINRTTQVFYYENRDRVYTQGVELNLKYRLSENFKVLGGYQYLQAKDKEQEKLIKSGSVYFRKTPTSPSQQLKISDYFGLANRSKHTANIKLFYQNYAHHFNANIRAVYRSKYALYDTNSSQEIIDKYDNFVKGAIRVNTAITKTIFKKVDFQLGIDNLLNAQGIDNKKLFPSNDAVLQVGRTYFVKIQWNL